MGHSAKWLFEKKSIGLRNLRSLVRISDFGMATSAKPGRIEQLLSNIVLCRLSSLSLFSSLSSPALPFFLWCGAGRAAPRETGHHGNHKKHVTLPDLCVSSLRRGHANLLCIVPILTDDLRRGSNNIGRHWLECRQ